MTVTNRAEFRQWLAEHNASATECWLCLRRGKPADDGAFYYLDAVEEALCFGWIDSTAKMIDGVSMQRFSPRKKNSPWTELNKERVRRLERLGLMTDAGRAVLPPMGKRSFHIDPDIERALKDARCWTKFRQFPELYQRIRAYNIAFAKAASKREKSQARLSYSEREQARPMVKAAKVRRKSTDVPRLTSSKRPRKAVCMANGMTTGG